MGNKNSGNASKIYIRGKGKGTLKKIVAVVLCVVFVGGVVAGCSCSTSGSNSNNTTTTATTGYKCDFTNKDIAIPKGTKLTDKGLELTKDADALVKNVLDVENQLPANLARDGAAEDPAVKYMQEVNERLLKWKNYNAVADYTAETVNQIDPTMGKVATLGSGVFDIVRAYYTGDISAEIEGVSSILNVFGIFGGGGGVTNEQILMEVQKVYSAIQQVALDVKDIQNLLSVMTNQLDEVTLQSYRNGLQTFDNGLIALDTDAEILQQMLVIGAEALQQQGVNPPAENASNAERQEYIGKLIAFIEEQQNTNPNLKNFDGIMTDLINNYTLVAGELGKTKDFSPITAFDSYWNSYFNWESQGYALKEAYRANAEFQVKRAYALMALYYNIGTGSTAAVYQKYGQLLANSLDSIEQNKPGISPEQVTNSLNVSEDYPYNESKSRPIIAINIDGQGLYSSTFDKRLVEIWDVSGNEANRDGKEGANEYTDDVKAITAKIPKELAQKYADKLHGRSLTDDLKLAGVWYRDMYSNTNSRGIDFNIRKDGKKILTNVIYYDGSYHEDQLLEYKGDDYDDKCPGEYFAGGYITGTYDDGDAPYYYTYDLMFNVQ